MKPAIPITDPAFSYTPAIETDLRKRFAKVREQMAEQEARARAGIVTIPNKRRAG